MVVANPQTNSLRYLLWYPWPAQPEYSFHKASSHNPVGLKDTIKCV